MSQDQWIILLFKIVLVADLVCLAGFVAVYTRLAPWWRNPIGRTLVIKDLLLAAALTPSILSIFVHFNRLTSHIAAWADVITFGAIAPVMIWRIAVWVKIHRAKRGTAEAAEDIPQLGRSVMSTKTVIAVVCFIVAVVLGVVAAFVPPAHGRLIALAIAALGLGLAVQAS